MGSGDVYPAPVTYRKKMSRLVRDFAADETPALLELKGPGSDGAYARFSHVYGNIFSVTIVRMEREGMDRVRLVAHHPLTLYIECGANHHPKKARWELMQDAIERESEHRFSLNHVPWTSPA